MGTDQVVKEELQKVRRENDSLQDKLKDMQRRLTMLDSDKKDLERKIVIMNSKSSSNSNNDQVDHHIRSQIPLLGGRTPTPKGHHAHASGEHLIKIRLLEQENERLDEKFVDSNSNFPNWKFCMANVSKIFYKNEEK